MITYYNPKEATQYTIHTTQQSPFSLATNIKCLEWTYSKCPKASRVAFGRRRIRASHPTMVSPVSGDPCRGWRLEIPWIQACCADRWGWLIALALQVLTTHSFVVFGIVGTTICKERNINMVPEIRVSSPSLPWCSGGAELPGMHKGDLKRFGFAP